MLVPCAPPWDLVIHAGLLGVMNMSADLDLVA